MKAKFLIALWLYSSLTIAAPTTNWHLDVFVDDKPPQEITLSVTLNSEPQETVLSKVEGWSSCKAYPPKLTSIYEEKTKQVISSFESILSCETKEKLIVNFRCSVEQNDLASSTGSFSSKGASYSSQKNLLTSPKGAVNVIGICTGR